MFNFLLIFTHYGEFARGDDDDDEEEGSSHKTSDLFVNTNAQETVAREKLAKEKLAEVWFIFVSN